MGILGPQSVMYGKATETAIAAMSRLAEAHGKQRLSAIDIATQRGLQGPFVAKVLTSLSRAGLVVGARGPGGGFTLAKEPSEITLYEVYTLFEREDDRDFCPFGGGTCGVGDPCALHDKLVDLEDARRELLVNTTFAVFQTEEGSDSQNGRPTDPPTVPVPRDSYRAPRRRG